MKYAFINGVRQPQLEKLTPAMWKMLFDTSSTGNPWDSLRGRSEMGGSAWTHLGLKKRGLMERDKLTPAGKIALTVEWRDEK